MITGAVTGEIGLDGPAPAGAVQVDISGGASVPQGAVRVAEGQTMGRFTLDAMFPLLFPVGASLAARATLLTWSSRHDWVKSPRRPCSTWCLHNDNGLRLHGGCALHPQEVATKSAYWGHPRAREGCRRSLAVPGARRITIHPFSRAHTSATVPTLSRIQAAIKVVSS